MAHGLVFLPTHGKKISCVCFRSRLRLGQIETSRDAIGVIINFLYRDKAASVVRVDKAEQPAIPQQANAPDSPHIVQEH